MLDRFRDYYNEQRPHRSINRRTPTFAYELIPKPHRPHPTTRTYGGSATTASTPAGRFHCATPTGCCTWASADLAAGTDVIILIHNTEVTVIDPDGTVFSEHRIDPERTYQPQTKNG